MNRFVSRVILLGLLALLGACATVYDVRPQVSGNQIQVSEGTREALRLSKKHLVEVGALDGRMRQFDDLRFVVSFTNKGQRSVLFSPRQIEARLNGGAVHALSYEAQLQRIQSRIDYYRSSLLIYNYPCCVRDSAFHAGFDDRSFDRLDLQQAYDDLERLTQFGLRSTEVKPGETVRGEVVLSSRLPAGSVQHLTLEVRVDAEVYPFEFVYQSTR